MQHNGSERGRHIRERMSNHAPWGVIHLDANLQIAGVNQWVLETFSVEEQSLITQHISSFLTIRDSDVSASINSTNRSIKHSKQVSGHSIWAFSVR